MIGLILYKVLGIVYILLEYWLGKTSQVKANSLLELIIQLCTRILKKK